jgi:hypothetical protein
MDHDSSTAPSSTAPTSEPQRLRRNGKIEALRAARYAGQAPGPPPGQGQRAGEGDGLQGSMDCVVGTGDEPVCATVYPLGAVPRLSRAQATDRGGLVDDGAAGRAEAGPATAGPFDQSGSPEANDGFAATRGGPDPEDDAPASVDQDWRMQPYELCILFMHLVRIPALLADARRVLPADLFHSAGEFHLKVLWQVLRQMTSAEDTDFAISYEGVRTRVYEALLLHGPPRETLLDLVADREDVGSDGPPGLIYEAFHERQVGMHLTHDAGARLLRQLYAERVVHDEVLRNLRARDRLSTLNDFPEDLERLTRSHETLMSIGGCAAAGLALGDRWDEHERRVERGRGRELLGLRTGVPGLDERTAGLRGLVLLGARPGGGKTALAVHAAVGACRHHDDNDAVVVFLSLEMDADKVVSRIKCHVVDLPWDVYMRGSPGHAGPDGRGMLGPEDRALLEAGRGRMARWQLDRRLLVVDRQALGGSWGAATVVRLVEEAKARAGAARALVVVDHLQYVPAAAPLRGERGGWAERRTEVEADRLRVGLVKDVLRRLKTEADPDPAVLLIAQSRKPPTARERDEWGAGLSEFLGSVEIGYAADAAVMLHYMADHDVPQFYECEPAPTSGSGLKAAQARHAAATAAFKERLRGRGISPVVAAMEKAREGMAPGRWALQFDYRRFKFEPAEPRLYRDVAGEGACDPGAVRAAAAPSADGSVGVDAARREKMLGALRAHPAGAQLSVLARGAGPTQKVALAVLEALVAEGRAGRGEGGSFLPVGAE